MSEMQLLSLATGLVFLLIGGICMALAWTRSITGPHPWTLVDAAAGLVSMIAFSAAGMLLYQAATGKEEGLFIAIMVFSALGALSSVSLVFLRASPSELGLTSFPLRWFILGLALVIPFMIFTAGWVSLVEWLMGVQEDQSIVQIVRDPGNELERFAGLFYAIGIAPIAEEILFRGFLLGAIQRSSGTTMAIATSGLIFGLFHISDPITLVPLTLMGICMGWLRVRSDSLWPGLGMHLGNNAAALLLVAAGEA